MKNKVYLVGAGPGKPDLITVRGLNILKEADVVIYDYLVDKRILDEAKEGAELICSEELRKERYSGSSLKAQGRINALMIKKTKEGKKVIRLKNGCPSIFSRLSEELSGLVKEKIDFEIVPGVTAASAASCLSGIPLTDRRFASSCVFVTGNEDPKKKKSSINWESIAKNETIVLYMAVGNLGLIVFKLLKAGKNENTPVAIIQDASLPNQKILIGNLGNIVTKAKGCKVKPPAIIIIGEVAKLEKKFNWLRLNKKVLFTGLSEERFFIKGIYFHIPMIEIRPLKDYTELDNWIKKIAKNSGHQLFQPEAGPPLVETINYQPVFDWIIFASRYGVEYFFNRLDTINLDSRVLSGIKIAAIGNSTANKLKEYGIIADLVPKKETSKGLLAEFKKILRLSAINHQPLTIFMPRSDISDKGLSNALKKLGAKVTTSVAYKNVMPKDLPDLDLNYFDEVMFTSPSTVRNFKKRYGEVPEGVKVNCIGEVTSREAKRQGLMDNSL